jgi:hypothetical protein
MRFLQEVSSSTPFMLLVKLLVLKVLTASLLLASTVTIGMLVESMAGKAGACHATFQDSTPFRFCEGQRAVDFFGEQVSSFSLVLGQPVVDGNVAVCLSLPARVSWLQLLWHRDDVQRCHWRGVTV